jgi:DNA-binding MarR family transcriptional regulator
MQITDPNRSLGWLVHDVSRLLRKRFDQRARDLGLTRSQYYLLGKLCRNEGINQVGLAEMLEVEPITLARLVDRMENGGWIERRPDPGDRRARRLYLTAKSGPMLARMQAIAAEVYEEALKQMDDTDREGLVDALQQVRRNLAEIATEPPGVAVDDSAGRGRDRGAAAAAGD